MEQASPLAPQLTTNKETADPSYRAAGHKKRKAAAAAAVADQPGSGNKRQQQQQASAAAVVSQPDNQPRPAAAAAAAPTADAQDDDDAVRRLFRSWAWKREHRCVRTLTWMPTRQSSLQDNSQQLEDLCT
jgi:hypothetical protein